MAPDQLNEVQMAPSSIVFLTHKLNRIVIADGYDYRPSDGRIYGGAAYVYVKNSAGVWNLNAVVSVPSSYNSYYFGQYVLTSS